MDGAYCHNQLLRIFSGSWELGRGRIIQWSLPEGRRQAFGNLVSWERSLVSSIEEVMTYLS